MKTSKRIFLLMGIFYSMTIPVQATHLMGGEITARHLTDSIYEITLTTYRDTFGIPMDTIANFVLRDSNGTTVMTFQTPYDTNISGGTLALYPYGVEVYIFRDTIHLPHQGEFHLSFLDCCRNGAIQNLSQPLLENMYLTTTLTYFNNANNSTPFFLVQPVIFLPVNTSWAYNPLPFDIDGDSLVWSLDTPLTDFNTACVGYTPPPSVSTNPFSLNSVTGSITWTASTLGNFDATVLVEEYRNNVKIGEIRRDMQFIVINASTNMARMTNMHEIPQDNNGNPHVSLMTNELYDFSFFADDPDSLDVVYMNAFGEPFMLGQGHQALFNTRKTGGAIGNEIEGLFSWRPTTYEVRHKPYLVVYRVTDGVLAMDYTVLYSVEDSTSSTTTGIDENNADNSLQVFPNPAENQLNIAFKLSEKKNLNIEIFNVYGMLIYSRQVSQMSDGNHVIGIPIDFESGSYIVSLKSDSELLGYKQVVVK